MFRVGQAGLHRRDGSWPPWLLLGSSAPGPDKLTPTRSVLGARHFIYTSSLQETRRHNETTITPDHHTPQRLSTMEVEEKVTPKLRARRPHRSAPVPTCFRICLIASIVVGCVIVIAAAYCFLIVLRAMFSPYFNLRAAEVSSAVVPLVDLETRFDLGLVLSVKTNATSHNPPATTPFAREAHDILFSGIVARDYSLDKSKQVSTDVAFEFPLDRLLVARNIFTYVCLLTPPAEAETPPKWMSKVPSSSCQTDALVSTK